MGWLRSRCCVAHAHFAGVYSASLMALSVSGIWLPVSTLRSVRRSMDSERRWQRARRAVEFGRRSIAVGARSFDLSSGPPHKEMPGVEPAPRSALGTQREVMW
jgi:hypothetical protein